nr:hypothetical protein I308_06280 [Cryptococcus tetragattii IND107]
MSSSRGHPANETYPSPLCYVPFDINPPYSVPNTAKSAKDGRAPSISSNRSISKIKSISETSSEKGATTPDFVFRVFRDDVVKNVCAIGELKWRTKSEKEQQRNSFYYACKEGIFQTVWYLVAAFDLFKCRLGFTIVDWSFCRQAMMENEAGRNVVVLEANDEAVKKFHSQYGDTLSANDLDNLEEVWSDMPNTLFTENWEIDQEARDRFEGTILLIIAAAAATSDLSPVSP